MASQDRPGGVTALAVINFIFGALGLLGTVAMFALIPLMNMALDQGGDQMPPDQRAQVEAMADMSMSLLLVLGVISLVTAVLLILSGIGYLKLKKFLGRTLGNVYGVVGVVATVGQAALMPAAIGGGMNIMMLINLIYPVLTLFLLNVTFKEDFVN